MTNVLDQQAFRTAISDVGIQPFACGGLNKTCVFAELSRDLVQPFLRVDREVGTLGEVLAQQAIGVLVRPALPRTLRIAEVDRGIGR